MARKFCNHREQMRDITRRILGDLTLNHSEGEKAIAPLADVLLGRTLCKRDAHNNGLDMCDLVEILRRDFHVPVVCEYPNGEDGDTLISMLPAEIAAFIGHGRSEQIRRWRDVVSANDLAYGANCAIELHAELNLPLSIAAASALTRPRYVPDLNAGDSYAMTKAKCFSPVEPRETEDE